jgi:hypothetical protein
LLRFALGLAPFAVPVQINFIYVSLQNIDYCSYLFRLVFFLSLLPFHRGGYPASVLRRSLSRCWGVVQLVGHLTVNEDGEGSNPSAPANPIDS